MLSSQSLTLIQECGDELYGDFDNSHPEAVDELEAALKQSTVSSSGGLQSQQSPNLALPSSAHISGGTTASRNAQSEDAKSPSHQTSGSCRPCINPSQTSQSCKYLELCVNTGEFHKTLAEITISAQSSTKCSAITTDGELFKAIKDQYLRVRGFRAQHFFLLKPTAVQFVKVSTSSNISVFVSLSPRAHKRTCQV